jgi:2',3'-cyclic-nucleotide 2'-phosphodiesterase (5'-nucleotidase family)
MWCELTGWKMFIVISRRFVTSAALLVGMLLAGTACTSAQTKSPTRLDSPPGASTAARVHRGEVHVTIFHGTHFDGAWALGEGQDFARRAALLHRLRAALPEPSNALVVGNGDDIDPGAGRGSVVDNQLGVEHGPDTAGRYAFEAFNAIGMDAETYGFNELDWIDRLAQQLRRARFAMVSANVRDRTTGQVFGAQYGAQAYVVKVVAGVRFGITGAISTEGPPVPLRPTVEVIEPARALAEVVPRMRAAGADIVVVLSHLDTRTEAQRIAQTVPGIDLILGTHIGEPLATPQRVGGTLLSVPAWGVDNLGALDLTIRDGRIADAVLHQYTVEANDPADTAVKGILDRYLPAR